MKQESFIYKIFTWILKKIGIIETKEISKSEMCERAKKIRSHECECCAWNENR